MKQTFILSILLCLTIAAQSAENSYPVPPKSDKMLFYLQRSHNRNTIIYELNTLLDKSIDMSNPINISWIRYEEGGRKADLSFIQRRAFGVKCKQKDKTKPVYSLQFNNFNKREIALLRNSAGIYRAYIRINNETAELESVYIKSEKNALGMSLNFIYMDLFGVSTTSHKKVTERINL